MLMSTPCLDHIEKEISYSHSRTVFWITEVGPVLHLSPVEAHFVEVRDMAKHI